jgi:SH3-like domain-containing protein
MTRSLPLTAIGLLLAVGAGVIFVLPADKSGASATVSHPKPSAASGMYTALLAEATVMPKTTVAPALVVGNAAAPRPASVIPVSLHDGVQAPLSATAASPVNQPLNQSAVGPTAVNVRAAANSSSAVVGVLQPGQIVTISTAANGWTQVSMPTGETGWVYSRYLTSSAGAPAATGMATSDGQATGAAVQPRPKANPLIGRRARLGSGFEGRSGPSMSSPSTGPLEAGSSVRIVEARGAWLHVVTSDGTSAWIRRG